MSEDEFIYGRNALKELLERSPETVAKIYVKTGIRGDSVDAIFNLSSAHKIPLQQVPGKKLNDLVGAVNDQGVVAQVSSRSYLELDEWLEVVNMQENPFVLMLDEIEDPHNFGAILRTAAACGVAGVIVPKHRQAPVNATVYKTSAGAADLVNLIRVVNLNQTILKMKEAGFWICGLDQNAKTVYWQQKFDMPVALVVGSEGRGIRKKTLEHCDFTVSIPMKKGVESLNASVSTALICYEVERQRESSD
ncbi:MAG: 23S rRNA (guanosine(2251)-2'-O)-methyltransferase RlmB [Balneolales bacterium]